MNARTCSTCEYHKPESDPKPGKPIPNHSGKCIRPTGLCDHIANATVEDPEPPAIIPEISEERETELIDVQDTAAAVTQAVMDAEEVYRDLGRIETAAFYATVSDSLLAQTYQKIKKNKSYKNIPYIDADGKARHIASLEEFCEVKLGKSARRLQELSQNLNILGTDLYESAERIGFRAKDYRALKALPEDEQAIVKQALEAESKDEVLNVLTDLTERHNAERQAAKKEKDDLTADLEARSKLLEDKSERLEKTEEELYRLKSLPPDANLELKLEREQEAVTELDKAVIIALAEFNGLILKVDAITSHQEVSLHTKQYAFQSVQMFCEGVQSALADNAIPVDFEEMVNPEWLRESAKTDLEAGNTEEQTGTRM